MDALWDRDSTIGERWKARLQFRLLLGAVVLFIASAYVCVRELRYLVSGKRAQGVFVEAFTKTTRGRYGSTSESRQVRYRFDDPAMAGVLVEDRWGTVKPATEQRTETDDVDDDWTPPASGTLEVQYLAGSSGSSRLAGNARAWMCIPFVVTTLVVAVLGVRFWRDYQEHERRKAAW